MSKATREAQSKMRELKLPYSYQRAVLDLIARGVSFEDALGWVMTSGDILEVPGPVEPAKGESDPNERFVWEPGEVERSGKA